MSAPIPMRKRGYNPGAYNTQKPQAPSSPRSPQAGQQGPPQPPPAAAPVAVTRPPPDPPPPQQPPPKASPPPRPTPQPSPPEDPVPLPSPPASLQPIQERNATLETALLEREGDLKRSEQRFADLERKFSLFQSTVSAIVQAQTTQSEELKDLSPTIALLVQRVGLSKGEPRSILKHSPRAKVQARPETPEPEARDCGTQTITEACAVAAQCNLGPAVLADTDEGSEFESSDDGYTPCPPTRRLCQAFSSNPSWQPGGDGLHSVHFEEPEGAMASPRGSASSGSPEMGRIFKGRSSSRRNHPEQTTARFYRLTDPPEPLGLSNHNR